MAKIVPVRLLLSEFISDRLQYKPYTAKLSSPLDKPIYVEISLPEDEVLKNTDEYVVISDTGLATLMGNVSDAIELMHNNYVKKFQKR